MFKKSQQFFICNDVSEMAWSLINQLNVFLNSLSENFSNFILEGLWLISNTRVVKAILESHDESAVERQTVTENAAVMRGGRD